MNATDQIPMFEARFDCIGQGESRTRKLGGPGLLERRLAQFFAVARQLGLFADLHTCAGGCGKTARFSTPGEVGWIGFALQIASVAGAVCSVDCLLRVRELHPVELKHGQRVRVPFVVPRDEMDDIF